MLSRRNPISPPCDSMLSDQSDFKPHFHIIYIIFRTGSRKRECRVSCGRQSNRSRLLSEQMVTSEEEEEPPLSHLLLSPAPTLLLASLNDSPVTDEGEPSARTLTHTHLTEACVCVNNK